MSLIHTDIRSQSKQIVYNVYKFLKELSSKPYLTADFFKPAQIRTGEACGVSERSVRRICSEAKHSESKSVLSFKSPRQTYNRSKIVSELDEFYDREEDVKLAELVSGYPCIFNAQHTLYKNKVVKDNVWQKISEDMNKNVDDCRKRWKNMKDTYNRHKRNGKLGTWALSDALSFLDVVLYERECLSSIQPYTNEYASEKENNSILEDADVQELNNTPSIIPSTSQGYVGPIEDNIEDINSVPEKRKSNTEEWPSKKQKQNEEWVYVIKQESEERENIFEIINKVEEDDPIDTFFKSLASTVKTYSTSLKIKAKKEIFNIVNNLEFENHGINNDSTPRIYSSYPITQSFQSTCTTYHPVPVEGLPEVANNYQISRENLMQYEEDYDQ